ncbi:MAG: pyridoxamine 5'-phosphate oxidase [Chloroflexi bacterium]|nr:MAG: pyridoxamine 5'-phosphate oxidase [Chloroflexota bacterium]
MPNADLRARIRQFLAEHTTLTLATVGEDGRPQAAALFYAETPALHLIFISEAKTRHSRNIASNPRIAATIQSDGQSWSEIQGLQLEGLCEPLSGKDAARARQVYLDKFPFIGQNKVLEMALSLVTFYRITPTWIRLIDNRRGFGHKEELRLA